MTGKVTGGGNIMDNKNVITAVETKINMLIERANANFSTSSEHRHEVRMARIDGMIEALEMLTGDKYTLTENGLTKAE